MGWNSDYHSTHCEILYLSFDTCKEVVRGTSFDGGGGGAMVSLHDQTFFFDSQLKRTYFRPDQKQPIFSQQSNTNHIFSPFI